MERLIPKELKHDLFVTHDSIKESCEYMRMVIEGLGATEKLPVIVAFQALINTIIAEEDKRDNT